MTVLWREYKGWSGCLVRGTVPVAVQDPRRHMSCAAWLTSEAECPQWGTCQSYDGAGISAGLLHNVLVYPKDLAQGDLGKLLRRMFDVKDAEPNAVAEKTLMDTLPLKGRQEGWRLAEDGRYRKANGALVGGADLRDWVAPPAGRVPRGGDHWTRAAYIATIFHKLFSRPELFKVQEDFAIEWLARGNRSAELEVYRRYTEDPSLDSAIMLPVDALPPSVHVAMCVYHNMSVNSPAVAARCLNVAMQKSTDPVEFSKALVRELGTHGRDVWHDQPGDGGNRYDRTRVAAWGRPDLFPAAREVMPRDL